MTQRPAIRTIPVQQLPTLQDRRMILKMQLRMLPLRIRPPEHLQKVPRMKPERQQTRQLRLTENRPESPLEILLKLPDNRLLRPPSTEHLRKQPME